MAVACSLEASFRPAPVFRGSEPDVDAGAIVEEGMDVYGRGESYDRARWADSAASGGVVG